jgi:hypothetical protein
LIFFLHERTRQLQTLRGAGVLDNLFAVTCHYDLPKIQICHQVQVMGDR